MSFLFYAIVLASMVLYSNTITIIKKIKDGEDISNNKSLGVMLTGFIAFSLLNAILR